MRLEQNTFYRTYCHRNKSNRPCLLGFSLVELLVVIGIIAMLLSILMPSLLRARSIAMRVKCAHNLKQINIAVNLYVNANDNSYPCAQDPVSTEPFYWLWMGRGWRESVEPYLGGNIDVNSPSVLLCPADPTDSAMYESTSYAYSMSFYHSSEQIDSMNQVADTYTNPQLSIPQQVGDVAYPASKIIIGEWFSNHNLLDEDKGWWTWEGLRNYLFTDGRIQYLEARQIRPARDEFPDSNLTVHGIKGIDYSP